MVNNYLAHLDPFATYPQPDTAPGEYQAWKKPSENEASYLKLTPGEPQVEIGKPNYYTDIIKNVINFIPSRVAGLAGQDTAKTVSKETIQKVEEYLKRNDLGHVKVSVNLYKPGMVWKRTFANPRLMMITKLFSGTANALAQTLFPSKFLAGINIYDQYTDTVTLNNNDVSMALFACAQAKATAMRRNPILYNSAKDFLPTATPIGNLNASLDVINYLQHYGTNEEVQKAIKLQSASTGMAFGIDVLQTMSLAGILGKVAFTIFPLVSCYRNGPSKEIFNWMSDSWPNGINEMFQDLPFETCLELQIYGKNINSHQDTLPTFLYDNAKSIAFIAICAFIGYRYGLYKVAQMQKEIEQSHIKKETVPVR